ncbi:MAG: hypothetical protein JO031_02120 [Ktedonobacteraceae bacterium]|nr:hypothetical protein [Ktedonobacteraceae bacterium]
MSRAFSVLTLQRLRCFAQEKNGVVPAPTAVGAGTTPFFSRGEASEMPKRQEEGTGKH